MGRASHRQFGRGEEGRAPSHDPLARLWRGLRLGVGSALVLVAWLAGSGRPSSLGGWLFVGVLLSVRLAVCLEGEGCEVEPAGKGRAVLLPCLAAAALVAGLDSDHLDAGALPPWLALLFVAAVPPLVQGLASAARPAPTFDCARTANWRQAPRRPGLRGPWRRRLGAALVLLLAPLAAGSLWALLPAAVAAWLVLCRRRRAPSAGRPSPFERLDRAAPA